MDILPFLYDGCKCNVTRKYCASVGGIGYLAYSEGIPHYSFLAGTHHHIGRRGGDYGDRLYLASTLWRRRPDGHLYGILLWRILPDHRKKPRALRLSDAYLVCRYRRKHRLVCH